MKGSSLDLTKGPITKQLIWFGLPILISNLFQQLYNTADTMLVGYFLGEEALAAVGATGAIFELIIGFALGMGNGMGIVVARHYGAKDQEAVKKSVAAALVIGLVISSLIMLIGAFGLYPLLELLGTPSQIIDQSYAYISTIMMAVLITFTYNLGAAFLRAIGNSLTALYFLIFSALVNILLDTIFITQLGLGVRGAGLATIISQGLSSGLCLLYIYRKCPVLWPDKTHFKLELPMVKDLLGQGLSMALMFSIVSVGTVILQTAINGFGTILIGAQVTARRVQAFFMLPMTALAASAATFTSQNLGARQIGRIGAGIRQASLMTVGWGLLAALVLNLWGRDLVALISGSSQAELLAAGRSYLAFSSLFYPVLGVLFLLRNSLQGLGQKLTPLVSSLIELLGKLIFTLVIIPRLGYWGVILCEPLIWVPMTIQLYFAYKNHPMNTSSKPL